MELYSLANNQVVVVTENSLTLFSYDTAVCKITYIGFREIVFSHKWDYSKTTVKYVCRFLSDYFNEDFNKSIIKKMLDKKEYEGRYCNSFQVKLVENI